MNIIFVHAYTSLGNTVLKKCIHKWKAKFAQSHSLGALYLYIWSSAIVSVSGDPSASLSNSGLNNKCTFNFKVNLDKFEQLHIFDIVWSS